MLAFGSPGIVSMILIVSSLVSLLAFPQKVLRVAKTRGAAMDRVRRLTCHEYLSLSALRAGWLRSSSGPAVSADASLVA
jgi:hypothetical protein